MSFRIEIEGIDELKADWVTGCRELTTDLAQATSHAVQVATRQIKADVPYQTGELQRSVKPNARATSNGGTGEVTIDAPHAGYVLDGTPKHEIRAKGKALRWMVGGQPRFAKSVEHPGTKPQDFLYSGVDQAEATLDRDANRAVDKLKQRIEG